MAVTNVAKRFLAAAAKQPVDAYLSQGKVGHLFKNAEKEAFDQFDAHVKQYASMPSKELLIEWWSEIPNTPEPAEFYLARLRNRFMEHFLQETVAEANKLVGADKCEDAAALIVERINSQLVHRHGTRLITMADAYEMVQQNYFKQMKLGDDYGIRLGYPVVDDYGGLVGGDVLSIVGRPAAGKSFLQLRGAHRCWRLGKRPAFISMEMNNLISAQRLVAMDAGVPLNALKLQKGQGLSTPQMVKMQGAQAKVGAHGEDFFLMDGNLSTTVEEVWNFCRRLKPDVLFIDGAYMLKHPNPRLGRFERVAENCELLKQEIAGNLSIPVAASWQFSREAAKKMGTKKGGAVGLEDIGYSDAIGQISSIVLGLLEDETVETMHKKTVTIMKGRSGETGEFPIHWEFEPLMNFDQYVEQELGDLSYI
jgi:replicative DNA helicase